MLRSGFWGSQSMTPCSLVCFSLHVCFYCSGFGMTVIIEKLKLLPIRCFPDGTAIVDQNVTVLFCKIPKIQPRAMTEPLLGLLLYRSPDLLHTSTWLWDTVHLLQRDAGALKTIVPHLVSFLKSVLKTHSHMSCFQLTALNDSPFW